MKTWLTTLCICLCCFSANASPSHSNAIEDKDDGNTPTEKKNLEATRIIKAPTIDGVLDELEWDKAMIATDFVVRDPNPGEAPTYPTEVRVLYDNTSIYIGAKCYDDEPDKIAKTLSQRDQIENSDFFGIAIDSYQDGVNGIELFVLASGVQVDNTISANGGDRNWNAVWASEVQITDEGWTIEMRVPFSALRFPDVEEQRWNVNFFRSIRRIRETSFWSPINPEVSGYFNQAGELRGLTDLEAPVRLFLYPYVSGIYEHYSGDAENDAASDTKFNGGADIKYGLNDAFTLDMTLVPDFSQVRSDNQVLNLSPFEIQFDENRQFFTEGTELFNKGNLFYSRRIGGQPLNYYAVYDEIDEDYEEIVSHPSTTRLVNATKISGRNKSNLGIGFFNAVVGRSTAVIANKESKEQREIEINPLTNYNIIVFDQALKNNSYVSLINTSVIREGSAYDANVTGTEFDLKNKENSYSINGRAAVSQIYNGDGGDTDLGFTYNLRAQKISGNFTGTVEYLVESDTYNPNDMGILFSNNQRSIGLGGNYNIYKPFWKFNRLGVNLWTGYDRLYKPNKFTNFFINPSVFMIWKNFFANGFFMVFEPIETRDYFEPRTSDFSLFYAYPTNFTVGGWISSDYRKQLALDVRTNYRTFDDANRYTFNFNIAPRFRVNDKIMLIYEFSRNYTNDDIGYILPQECTAADTLCFDPDLPALTSDQVTFGRRNFTTIENVFNASYIFTNKMSLTLWLRHNWSIVKYTKYHKLQEDGYLGDTSYKGISNQNESYHNQNFNAFNIDMNFRWQFAPGSELNLTWKNSILNSDLYTDIGFNENLKNTFDAPKTNSISLKVLYFIDYFSLKSKLKS